MQANTEPQIMSDCTNDKTAPEMPQTSPVNSKPNPNPHCELEPTENKGDNENLIISNQDGHYRRSLSEDKKPTPLQDCKYVSTDCMVSNSKDWKSSSNFMNTGQSNVSSKFGGSTFSITRHKKIDLSAYDEERTETNSNRKLDELESNEKSKSFDVLEKAAAIVFEQVSK